MRTARFPTTLTAGALAALVLTGCQPAEADPDATTVEVSFTDSSVAPEHHRSWDLEIDAEEVQLRVRDYEQVLHTGTAETPSEPWASLVAELPGEVDHLDGDSVEGCAGGTSLEVVVRAGSRVERGSVESCGAEGAADGEALLALLAPFTDAVDLARHTRGG